MTPTTVAERRAFVLAGLREGSLQPATGRRLLSGALAKAGLASAQRKSLEKLGKSDGQARGTTVDIARRRLIGFARAE